MPRATVSFEPEEHVLKSCPGGWVKLRRMSYGERLHRSDMMMSMSMAADGSNKSAQVEVKQTQTAVVQYELSTCMVAHNLEDEHGAELNFRNPAHIAALDPRIGEEISSLVDKMHDWEPDLPNSEEKSTESSTTSGPLQGVVLPTSTTVSPPAS